MSLNIKHPDADKLARALANKTGESITQAVIISLKERLLREEGRNLPSSLSEELLKIGHRCSILPDLDMRTPDEIMGYDQHGVPATSQDVPSSHKASLTKESSAKGATKAENNVHGNAHGH